MFCTHAKITGSMISIELPKQNRLQNDVGFQEVDMPRFAAHGPRVPHSLQVSMAP
jgi:hypothetical protein